MQSFGHFFLHAPHFWPLVWTYRAGGLVDQVGVRYRLGERDVDGLALGDAGVELTRYAHRADVAAQTAGHACRFVHTARVPQDRRLERPRHTRHRLDLGVGEEVDHLVLPHGHHLGRQDAGGAVQRGERLVEHRHVAADGARALNEVHTLAPVRDLQRRLDAGDAAADDQGGGVPLGVLGLSGEREGHPVHGAGDDGLRPVCGRVAAQSVLAEGGEPDFVGLASGECHGSGERRLEEPGRVAGDHDPLNALGGYLVGDRLRIELGQDAHGPHAAPPGGGWLRSGPRTRS